MRRFVLALILVCATAGGSMAQNPAKEAIKRAEGVEFSVAVPKDVCYLFPGGVVYSLDGVEVGHPLLGFSEAFAMSSGPHSLLVASVDKVRKKDGKSVTCDFVAGRYYFLSYDKTSEEFQVKEATIIDTVTTSGGLGRFEYLSPRPVVGPGFPIGEYCYLKPDAGIGSIAGIIAKGGLIPPGKHTLSVTAIDGISRNIVSYRKARVQFDFEAGKSYSVGFDEGKKEFFLKEDEGGEVDYIASLLNGPVERRLDGTWYCERKWAMNVFYMKYTIDGDRMLFEMKNKRNGDKTYSAEGRIVYNDDTIILTLEKVMANDKENNNYLPKCVWYYTLVDGALTLEGGKMFNLNGPLWLNTGEFHKTN